MLLNCGVGELESPLDCKEIQPVRPKWDQSWVFIGRTDVEAETLILWPPDAKSWFIWRDPDAGKDWRWERKGMTEDESASPIQWKWIWVNSSNWWWTGRPGVLQSMRSQRIGHDSDWTELIYVCYKLSYLKIANICIPYAFLFFFCLSQHNF